MPVAVSHEQIKEYLVSSEEGRSFLANITEELCSEFGIDEKEQHETMQVFLQNPVQFEQTAKKKSTTSTGMLSFGEGELLGAMIVVLLPALWNLLSDILLRVVDESLDRSVNLGLDALKQVVIQRKMSPCLHIQYPDGQVTAHHIRKEVIRLGSLEEVNDIHLTSSDININPIHAELHRQDGVYRLVNPNKIADLWFNDAHLETIQPLSDGDHFFVGSPESTSHIKITFYQQYQPEPIKLANKKMAQVRRRIRKTCKQYNLPDAVVEQLTNNLLHQLNIS